MSQAKNLAKLAQNIDAQGLLGSAAIQGGGGGPKITSIIVTDSSYNNLDDTAVALAGGYIKITGSGFETGCQVLVGTTLATSVTFISATEVRAQVPATTAGTYILYVVNTDGGTAIRVNGITFSATPTWTTESPLAGVVNSAISIQLAATGATTFSVASGSSLPSGVSLSSSGLLTGTVAGISGSTTYNFTVLATDAELQDSPKTFAFNISVGDPNFMYTTLLLSANGTNAAQNNTFVDSSTNNFGITRTGNVAQGTFSPYGSNWSNFFGTAQHKLSTTGMTAFGTDFTLELWIFPTSFNDYNTIFDSRGGDGDANGVVLGLTSAAKVYFYTNASFQITTTTAISLNTWTHIALVRSGSGSGNVKVYINGVADATTATYTTSFTSTAPSIGDDWGNRGFLQYFGYLSNLRAVTSALYTSTFTPSTTPLTAISGTVLLTCQSNRFIDNSASALTMTVTGTPSVQRFNPFGASTAYSTSTIGGSAYFDGTGDYLTVPSNSAFAMGTGDFTIECWVNTPLVNIQNDVIIELRSSGGSSTGFVFNMNPTGTGYQLNFYTDGGFNLGSTVLNYNVWNHCAVTRSGGIIKLFSNGVVSATFTKTNNFYDTPVPHIGISPLYTANDMVGYLSDLRIVKGTALYTSTFTPPTAPLTAVSGTSLLFNFTNAGVIDSAMMNNAETVGNAQISTTQSKFGGSSMYFDGTGDYVSIPVTPNLQFGSGNFTIEAWIYPTNLGSYPLVAAQYGPNIYAFFFGLGPNDTKLGLYLYHAGGSVNVSTTNNVTLNTWNHVAAVRNGNTVTLYINGIAGGNVTYTQTVDNITVPISVGADSTGSYPFFGYIDDLRITKGYARYTSNFTPPALALLTQ